MYELMLNSEAIDAHADRDTRQRLLEAAMGAFAEHGFELISLRELTRAAGVNLAAVGYHFGSKEGLIDSLILSCLDPIMDRRLELLDELESQSGNKEGLSIEAILKAFMLPVIERATSDAPLCGEAFLKLMGRCMAEPGYRMPETALPKTEVFAARFTGAVVRTLPHLPEQQVLWRLHFTFGVLAQTLLHHDSLHRISGGRSGRPGHDELLDYVVDFCSAGFRAPVS